MRTFSRDCFAALLLRNQLVVISVFVFSVYFCKQSVTYVHNGVEVVAFVEKRMRSVEMKGSETSH